MKKRTKKGYIVEISLFLLSAILLSIYISPLFIRTLSSRNWESVNATVENLEEIVYPFNHKYAGTTKKRQFKFDLFYSYEGIEYSNINVLTSKLSSKNEISIFINPEDPMDIAFDMMNWKFLGIMGIIIVALYWAGISQLVLLIKYKDTI